jgi:hypothetical protein
VLDVDATLVTVHSEKESVAATFKGDIASTVAVPVWPCKGLAGESHERARRARTALGKAVDEPAPISPPTHSS